MYGLTQRMLAGLLRIDILTLRRWEIDQHQLNKRLLRKLERIFPELANAVRKIDSSEIFR
jgi:transcriptional regulator with XRE-family HTH domain